MITSRARVSFWIFILFFALMSAAIFWRLQSKIPDKHLSQTRMNAAQRVAKALVFNVPAPATVCAALQKEALQYEVSLTNVRSKSGLDKPIKPIYVDTAALLGAGENCDKIASELKNNRGDVLPLFSRRDSWRDGLAPLQHWSGERTHIATVSERDARTSNPYAMLPGQLYAADKGRIESSSDLAERRLHSEKVRYQSLSEVVFDPSLSSAMAPTIAQALQKPTQQKTLAEHTLPAGPDVEMTLDPDFQKTAFGWIRCYTGALGDCDSLPATLRDDPRFTIPAMAPRSPVAALIVAEVSSGKIIAMTGEMSDCARDKLQATVPQTDKLPVYTSATDRCAQLPDSKHLYLLSQHPAYWLIPPGSFAKVLITVACLSEINMSDAERALIKAKIAYSHDQDFFRDLALRCPNAITKLWQSYSAPIGLYPGLSKELALAAWPEQLTTSNLLESRKVKDCPDAALSKETIFNPTQYYAFDQKWKQAMYRVEHAFPKEKCKLFTSQALRDLAIGAGDHQANLLAILSIARDISLRADNVDSAAPLHLAFNRDAAPSTREILPQLGAERAKQVIDILSGVTASSMKGTAAGICSRVLKSCPPDGLKNFWGKTGTRDFTVNKTDKKSGKRTSDNSLIQEGQRLPAKVFFAGFESNKKKYIAVALTFRGRELNGKLELDGNAGAELVLLAKSYLDNSNIKNKN